MARDINLNFGDEDSHQEPKQDYQEIESLQGQPVEVQLTKEEQEQIDSFSKKIDLKDTNAILNYGVGAQKQIASFSDRTLENIKTKDLGEVGNLLSSVVNELRGFDKSEGEKGLFGFLKRGANKALDIKTKYDSTEHNVKTISKALNDHQVVLMKDVAKLDEMYELNESYFKELSMYILAGRKKLEESYNVELPQALAKAEQSGLPQDAQKVNDLQQAINRFEKKIHDLELTRMVSLQMAPQIRMIQASNSVMIEKIQSTIVNTIPLWKTQMSLALSATHTGQAAKAQKEVADFTNELLRKNADDLKMASVETARQSERGIVDIDTVKHINDQLISALVEVQDIQKQGHSQRQQASEELQKLEQELKQRLLDIAQN